MAYRDLNPVRAKIVGSVATSRYTSAKMRNQQLQKNSERAKRAIFQFAGYFGSELH